MQRATISKLWPREAGSRDARSQTGQASLDFALAMIIAGIFFITMNAFTTALQDDTANLSESNAAKVMLLDAYSATGMAKAYKKSAASAMQVDINIQSPANRAYSPCSVTFSAADPANAEIIAIAGKSTQKYSGLNLTGLTFTPSSANCGQQVRIT